MLAAVYSPHTAAPVLVNCTLTTVPMPPWAGCACAPAISVPSSSVAASTYLAVPSTSQATSGSAGSS